MFVSLLLFLLVIYSSEITGSYTSPVYTFLRTCHTVFCSDYTILHFFLLTVYESANFSTFLSQHLVFSVLFCCGGGF